MSIRPREHQRTNVKPRTRGKRSNLWADKPPKTTRHRKMIFSNARSPTYRMDSCRQEIDPASLPVSITGLQGTLRSRNFCHVPFISRNANLVFCLLGANHLFLSLFVNNPTPSSNWSILPATFTGRKRAVMCNFPFGWSIQQQLTVNPLETVASGEEAQLPMKASVWGGSAEASVMWIKASVTPTVLGFYACEERNS